MREAQPHPYVVHGVDYDASQLVRLRGFTDFDASHESIVLLALREFVFVRFNKGRDATEAADKSSKAAKEFNGGFAREKQLPRSCQYSEKYGGTFVCSWSAQTGMIPMLLGLKNITLVVEYEDESGTESFAINVGSVRNRPRQLRVCGEIGPNLGTRDGAKQAVVQDQGVLGSLFDEGAWTSFNTNKRRIPVGSDKIIMTMEHTVRVVGIAFGTTAEYLNIVVAEATRDLPVSTISIDTNTSYCPVVYVEFSEECAVLEGIEALRHCDLLPAQHAKVHVRRLRGWRVYGYIADGERAVDAVLEEDQTSRIRPSPNGPQKITITIFNDAVNTGGHYITVGMLRLVSCIFCDNESLSIFLWALEGGEGIAIHHMMGSKNPLSVPRPLAAVAVADGMQAGKCTHISSHSHT
jgi:hypothetical protein